ncbi:MAG: hypothetical protein AB7O52_12165 [Planctomycetota bacterium]
MTRSSAVPSKSRKSRESVAPAEGNSTARFEPTDLVAALVLFFAIPAITFVALDFIGYPVGGPSKSASELLAMKEEKVKRQPPITREEVKEKLAYVNKVVEERANDYLIRFRQADPDPRKNVERQRWCDYGLSTLGWAQSSLDSLLSVVEAQADLAEFVPRIKGRLFEVKAMRDDLQKQTLVVE